MGSWTEHCFRSMLQCAHNAWDTFDTNRSCQSSRVRTSIVEPLYPLREITFMPGFSSLKRTGMILATIVCKVHSFSWWFTRLRGSIRSLHLGRNSLGTSATDC